MLGILAVALFLIFIYSETYFACNLHHTCHTKGREFCSPRYVLLKSTNQEHML